MAMASTSISCTSSVSTVSCILTNNRAASAQQSAAAAAVQCFSRRALGNWLLARERTCSAGVVLRRSSMQRIVGGNTNKLRKQQELWRVDAGLKETALTEQQWGPPVTLGTAQLPQDVDLNKLQTLLYQVDKVDGGVRLGYIRVTDGKTEDLVHIDVIVTPASDEQPKAMFRAIRNGQMKNSVPPGEPLIMQSLLAALKLSIALARPSS